MLCCAHLAVCLLLTFSRKQSLGGPEPIELCVYIHSELVRQSQLVRCEALAREALHIRFNDGSRVQRAIERRQAIVRFEQLCVAAPALAQQHPLAIAEIKKTAGSPNKHRRVRVRRPSNCL